MEKIKMIAAMLIVGSIGIFVSYISLPSSVIACSRAVIGTVFLIMVLLIRKTKIKWNLVKSNWIFLLISGGALGFNWIFLFEAYKYTSVAIATLCYYMAPVFVILLSPIILKEKLTMFKLGCTIMAIIGAVLISGVFGSGVQDLKGIGFGLVAALLYAGIIMVNKFINGLSGVEITLCQLAISAIIMIPYVIFTQDIVLANFDTTTIILLLIVGIVHTGIVYILFFSGINKLPAQTSAILSYIDPVTAIFLSALLLKQPMGTVQIIGTALILGSAILNNKNNKEV